MNVLNIGIIIFILFGAVLGFKRGFTKEVVKAAGFLIIVVLAYLLKNPLSVLLYEHLPFFHIGILKGVEVLNILVYEFLAFIIVLIILSIILKVVLMATSMFEKILTATIILGIPSKIAGALVGILHHYIVAFIILTILSLPVFNVGIVKDSSLREKIVNDTPLLSIAVDKSMSVINEFMDLKERYDDKTVSEQEFNCGAVQLFTKYEVISQESLQKLIDAGKVDYTGC